VGCGVGLSTLLMAKAFPTSKFVGFDFHEPSIEEARRHAQQHGFDGRVRFEVAKAKEIKESDFDLITFFDCPASRRPTGRRRALIAHHHRIKLRSTALAVLRIGQSQNESREISRNRRVFHRIQLLPLSPTMKTHPRGNYPCVQSCGHRYFP
jgi:ubiquinone/menaquinone biosynthesis C-methylase UbiE